MLEKIKNIKAYIFPMSNASRGIYFFVMGIDYRLVQNKIFLLKNKILEIK